MLLYRDMQQLSESQTNQLPESASLFIGLPEAETLLPKKPDQIIM